MASLLKTRLVKLEKDCQPAQPQAIAIWYADESEEEARQRFREETGNVPGIVIHYWRKRPLTKSDAAQGGIAIVDTAPR